VLSQKKVKRQRLGRSASIATQQALSEQEKSVPVFAEAITKIISMIRCPGNAYFSSFEFASDLLALCDGVCPLLESEARVLELQSPLYVFGDVHGNLDDLRFFCDHVWPLGMNLTAGRFLFLGDYVDRGKAGLEVIAYLFAQKLFVPHKLYLLRGNHEARCVNGWEEHYKDGSLLRQCKQRFGHDPGIQLWEAVNKAFDRMPLAATIDRKIFCIHGGIPRGPSPGQPDTRLADIRAIPPVIDVRPPAAENPDPVNLLAFICLWADPADQEQEVTLDSHGFGSSTRGGGTVIFGHKAVDDFLSAHGFSHIFRAHEATASGIAVSKGAKVITVFSTSKDHGCGSDAVCGCVLVDQGIRPGGEVYPMIKAINRSAHYYAATND